MAPPPLPDGGTPFDGATPAPPDADGAPSECPVLPFRRPPGVPSGGSGGPPGVTDDTLTVSGATRSFRVVVPPCHQEGRLYGLAVVLHDADGDRHYLEFKWREAARTHGYVVVLPAARRGENGLFHWLDEQDDNATFIRLLVEHLEARYNLDRSDTVVAGLGVGATFAGMLALPPDPEADAGTPPLFENLLWVNGSFLDRDFGRTVAAFLVDGRRDLASEPEFAPFRDAPALRFVFVPGLRDAYPGPACPCRPGDPEILRPDTATALDFFWEVASR